MSYCFLDYLPARDGHGLEPDCPPRIDCLVLADGPGGEWGLFEIDDDDTWAPETPVSDELVALIESGKRYPPALALARDEMGLVFDDHCPSQADFASAYRTALQTHLARQHESPYVLAEALTDEVVELTRGEWYWILDISGSPPAVSWVSDDFYVYRSDMSDFDLTGQQLKQLGYSG